MAGNKVTLTIQFGEGADSSLLAVALLDDELNRDAAGEVKSSFASGDQPYFLVHLDPALAVGSVRCSSGSARFLGEVTRTEEADIDADAAGDTAELSYLPAGGVSGTWYGNQPGMTVNGRTLTWAEPLPATGKLRYSYRAYSYRYSPPALRPDQEWRVRIVIQAVPR